jgi:iron(III) transport system substrate-binding protein
MKKPMIAAAGALLTLALVLTGCGSAQVAPGAAGADRENTAVFDEINGLSGQERTDRLVELAEEEGALTLYTSNTDMDALVTAFEETYEIEVDSTRANSETVLQKIMSEREAGSLKVDVVDNNFNENNVMAQAGLFADYQSEYRDAVREDGQLDGWTSTYVNAFVVGWNTDKIDGSTLPDEIKDFTDPKWKGKISLEIGDVDWYGAVTTHYLEQGMSQEEVDKMWADLAANATFEKGHSAMSDMLSAGKIDIALSIYQHNVDGSAHDNGAPIAWKHEGKAVAPVVTRPNGAGILANAEHPAAAMLFMDFLLTQGQDIQAEQFRIGSVPRAENPITGIDIVPVPLDEMTENVEYWDDRYRDLVGG